MMSQASLPPLVRGWPILGSIPQLLLNFPKLAQDTAPSLGDVSRIRVGKTELIVLAHPEHLQYVMRDNHKNFRRGGEGSTGLDRVIGRGLITLEGDEWLQERRMMQPYFHRKYLPNLLSLMEAAIDEQLDILENEIKDGKELDFAPLVKRITISVFLNAMFSTSMDARNIQHLGESYDVAIRLNQQRERLNYFVPKNIKLPLDKKVQDGVAYVDEQIIKIIEARRSMKTEREDLLGYLIEASDEENGAKFSTRQLVDESKTLTIGGYDTTSGSVMWALHCLSKHPQAAEKLRKETDAINGKLTMEAIQELSYTRKVLDESMRLYPVGWINNRVSVEEDEIGGYRIPPESVTLFAVLRIHRDERFWKDAMSFKPERWEENHGGATHRFAYTPFGAGPRVCLGEQFALTEGVMLLAKLLQRFEITSLEDEPKDVAYEFTMQPRVFPVRIKKRVPEAVAVR